MIRNYFKIAWRNLIRNKSFSILNIVGLSLGLSIVILITAWINFELGYDQFHENNNRIYEVNNQYTVDGEIWTWNSTPKIMASTIKKDYPEVEAVTRYFHGTSFLFAKGDKRIKSTGTIVDPVFLNIFSFPLLEGDRETVLKEVNSVVITQTFSKRLFGNESPIGKIIKIDNKDNVTVTGVLDDLPNNTEFKFDFLIPWSYLKQRGWDDSNWSNNSVATYVLLKKGLDYNKFSEKIKHLRKKYDKRSPEMETYLYPFSRVHLYSEFEHGVESGGKIDTVRIIGIIAIIILIIACINFMNLSTAQSERRSREVGIRKVVGAKKQILVVQFLGESLFITLIATFFAIGIAILALPAFSNLVENDIKLDFSSTWFWGSTFFIVIITGLLAGSYPALYLSAFRPSAVLKGTFYKINALVTPRKMLVVFQFSIAVILISATIIVKQQLEKIQDRQSGYSKNNLVYSIMEGDVEKKYSLIKEALLTSNTAVSVTKTSSPITEGWSNSWGFEWKGKDKNDKTIIQRLGADDAVTKTIGLQLVEGRDFDLKTYATDSTAAIINEKEVKHMGFKKSIGQIIKDNGIDWHVIGVVKDFVLKSPSQRVEPMVIEGAKGHSEVIHIKFNNLNRISENLANAEAIFKKFNPEYPFSYQFVDRAYAKKFDHQKKTGILVNVLALLAIIISCLGLFGLASFMVENRIKEIGIRKILGASIRNITALLTKEFLKPITIAFIIGLPISWYFMNNWLENFDYRTNITIRVFALTAIVTFSVALITIGYQVIKAAMSNPSKSLRTE